MEENNKKNAATTETAHAPKKKKASKPAEPTVEELDPAAAAKLKEEKLNALIEKGKKAVTFISVGLSIIAVLFLAMAREPYAITVTFLLLLIKGILLYKQAKAGR